MLPYQMVTVEKVLKLLNPGTKDILEIGSDLAGEVACALAERTGARVVGINPSEQFPALSGPRVPNTSFLRLDGREMPFPDNTFDAILSVATMEHVIGLDSFLAEVARVLKPKGVFFTEFGPLWSSAQGHHVYAVVGDKEARFWKPGKNPIPDYAHLLWTPDEMRAYLHSGPCSEELVEPIIRWVYYDDSLNRCHFEQYLESFGKNSLLIQDMQFGHDSLDSETASRLAAKYGNGRTFTCSSISALLRKAPEGAGGRLFRVGLALRRGLASWAVRQKGRIGFVVRGLLQR